MEGMREIARSYYERASEAVKASIEESFAKLDVDGDGKISLAEFKRSVSSWLRAEAVFEKLDVDGDGSIDFGEFLCLYYMEKKVDLAKCGGCYELLVGPYFSCLLCIEKGADTYDLCCSCYRHIDLPEHEHPAHYMRDHHSLLKEFKSRTAAADRSQNKNEVKELREIATAYYLAGSREVQDLALGFYRSMDSDGNDQVDSSEFLDFMSQENYSYTQSLELFRALDLDNNDTLDFFEVMTLYYVIKSGRPFCNGNCSRFIPGIFFSCVECFRNSKTSFDLCPNCYGEERYDHKHEGQAQFLDNYTLLQAMRDSTLAFAGESSGVNLNEARTGHDVVHMHNSYLTTNEHIHIHNHNPVVSAPLISKRKKLLLALETFELALKIGNISTTLCTIM